MGIKDQEVAQSEEDLMAEFFETHAYVGEVKPWREDPATGDDPDASDDEHSVPEDVADPDAVDPVIDPEVPGLMALSAGKEYHSGLMVAVPVPMDVATRLQVEDGVDPEDMHVTLCYVKGSTLDGKTDDEIEQLFDVVQDAVYACDPISYEVVDTAVFPASESSDGMDVLYARVVSPSLRALRRKVVEALTRAGAPPSSDFDYSPHITLSYVDTEDDDGEVPSASPKRETVPVQSVFVTYGEREVWFDLGVKSYRDESGLAKLQRLPMVNVKGVPSVRTADIFKRQVSRLRGALNRKTTMNSVESVPLEDLEPSVETIPRAGLERFVTHTRRDPADVMVVRGGRDGARRYVVQDGHTRLAAAILRGDEMMQVRLWSFEIDAAGDLVPESRGYHRRGSLHLGRDPEIHKKAWDTRGRKDDSTGTGKRAWEERLATGWRPKTGPLEDSPSRYFKIDKDTEMIPVSALRVQHAREDAILRAETHMREAADGTTEKRKPISVQKNADGTYAVIDGNSTTAIAQKNQWKKIPAKLLSYRQKLAFMLERDEAEAHRKAWDTRGRKDSGDGVSQAADDVAGNHDARDMVRSAGGTFDVNKVLTYVDETFRRDLNTIKQKAPDAQKELDSIMSDIVSEFGGKMVGYDDLVERSGVVAVAPVIKGDMRTVEKALVDLDGDFTQLRDFVRTTIAVDSLDDAAKVLKAIEGKVTLSRPPKNRLENPAGGYRDVQINVKMSNGIEAEVQLHVKSMLRAKESGHKLYKKMRSETNPAKVRELFMEGQQLYDSAWNSCCAKDWENRGMKLGADR